MYCTKCLKINPNPERDLLFCPSCILEMNKEHIYRNDKVHVEFTKNHLNRRFHYFLQHNSSSYSISFGLGGLTNLSKWTMELDGNIYPMKYRQEKSFFGVSGNTNFISFTLQSSGDASIIGDASASIRESTGDHFQFIINLKSKLSGVAITTKVITPSGEVINL